MAVTEELAKKKIGRKYGALVQLERWPGSPEGFSEERRRAYKRKTSFEINGIKVDDQIRSGNLIQRYSIGETISAKIRRVEKLWIYPSSSPNAPRNRERRDMPKLALALNIGSANVIKIPYYRI